jgi:hypothetical protein
MSITITILDIIHRPVFYLKYNVSETEYCPCVQEETSLYLLVPTGKIPLGDGHRIQSPKCCVLNKRQDDA